MLPKGIYFDPNRKRYRVRLYAGKPSHVIWLTYHTDLDEALAALDQALKYQQEIQRDLEQIRQRNKLNANHIPSTTYILKYL